MKKYRFKIQSVFLMEVVGRVFLLLSLFLLYFLYKICDSATEFVFALVVWILSVVLGIWITKKLCTAQIEMRIDTNGLEQVWLSQYLFSNQKNKTILWSEMSEFKFYSKNFEVDEYFELKLKNKRKIKIKRKYTENDEFSSFQSEFKYQFNNSARK